jgi:acyl carrier protein
MTPDQIRDKLATIIVEKLNSAVPRERVAWDSTLRDDLGIDSLGASELLFEIEDEFGTPIKSTDVNSLVTIRDAVNAIVRSMQAIQAS